ncbi:RHS repeat domain-containing protein [Streptomyces sp. NPDC051219]|uniref:RHS repeat domain-containing protein n=1 Tax=Streptomyces sp. NPDC051219 TaxID=3155283 RepID=UPI003422EDAC
MPCPSEVINSSGVPLRFAYDTVGRVTSWTDTNGRRYDYTYDDHDRCIAEGGSEGHVAARIDYGVPDPSPATGHRPPATGHRPQRSPTPSDTPPVTSSTMSIW